MKKETGNQPTPQRATEPQTPPAPDCARCGAPAADFVDAVDGTVFCGAACCDLMRRGF